jgi:hypothetical protein
MTLLSNLYDVYKKDLRTFIDLRETASEFYIENTVYLFIAMVVHAIFVCAVLIFFGDILGYILYEPEVDVDVITNTLGLLSGAFIIFSLNVMFISRSFRKPITKEQKNWIATLYEDGTCEGCVPNILDRGELLKHMNIISRINDERIRVSYDKQRIRFPRKV